MQFYILLVIFLIYFVASLGIAFYLEQRRKQAVVEARHFEKLNAVNAEWAEKQAKYIEALENHNKAYSAFGERQLSRALELEELLYGPQKNDAVKDDVKDD